MNLRKATLADRDAIYRLHWSAFPKEERAPIAQLAVDLLNTERNPGTTSWVGERDGQIIGHVAFSPVTSVTDKSFNGSILAPVAVHPDAQKQGAARKLIEQGVVCEKESGVDVLLVYGDPAFYGKFGFSAKQATPYVPPYDLEFRFGWQAIRFCSDRPIEEVPLTCVPSLQNSDLW